MDTKYLVGELPAGIGSAYGAIVFPGFMSHAEVARALHMQVEGAGFCHRDPDGELSCWGESTTLKIKSRGQEDCVEVDRLMEPTP